MNTKNNILELIGNTPLVKLNKISKDLNADIYVKLENQNPGASVKDRLAVAMIEDAEEKGLINSETEIIEPTSGNTGIGLAMVCAVKGYKLTITMPESMSVERRSLLKSYGVKLHLTKADAGMKGAINKAKELANSKQNTLVLGQFTNYANVEMHRRTTAAEIWKDTDGKIDIFIAGVGTGGTFTGVSSKLKELNNNIKTIAVEPHNSAVLSGEAPNSHKIQGIGAGFIPEIMDTTLIDEIIKIKETDAMDTARKLVIDEGIFSGISAGANVKAAIELAGRKENAGKIIVTVIPDTGERYLSTGLFNICL